jgi:hypothetical protein
MKSLQKDQKVIFIPNSQLGRIVSVYKGGTWGVFRAPNGAVFHVHANECREEGDPENFLDTLLNGGKP